MLGQWCTSACHQALDSLRRAISLFLRVIFPKTGVHFWVTRSRLTITALVVIAGLALPAFAQDLGEQNQGNQVELDDIQQQIERNRVERDRISGQIEQLQRERIRINRALIETAQRARKFEQNVTGTESRLRILSLQETDIKSSLHSRRHVLAAVLGALQRLGRAPPPALLVSPNDALTSVRSAIMMASVVPEIRAESDLLTQELTELAAVRREIAGKRDELKQQMDGLENQQTRLAELLREKKTLSAKARAELAARSTEAARLATKAETLGRLIAAIEEKLAVRRGPANTEQMVGGETADGTQTGRQRGTGERTAIFADPGRLKPAIAFAKAKGLLPRPVSGAEVQTFGQQDGFGELTKGIKLASRANAVVVTPADGWIVYAGPFRSYGKVVIVDAGDDYHIVLAGLEQVTAQTGRFVLSGEPVGKMGVHRIASAATLDIDSTRPVLYVEFRKGDNFVDPASWWAAKT